MSLQATEATVVTLGEDNLIIRWVLYIQSFQPVYINLCNTPQDTQHLHDVTLDLAGAGRDLYGQICPLDPGN